MPMGPATPASRLRRGGRRSAESRPDGSQGGCAPVRASGACVVPWSDMLGGKDGPVLTEGLGGWWVEGEAGGGRHGRARSLQGAARARAPASQPAPPPPAGRGRRTSREYMKKDPPRPPSFVRRRTDSREQSLQTNRRRRQARGRRLCPRAGINMAVAERTGRCKQGRCAVGSEVGRARLTAVQSDVSEREERR